MWIVYAFIIFLGLIACSLWGLACYAIYCAIKPKPKSVNPYKAAHLLWEENDKNFDSYLDWLANTKRSGVPLGKVKSHSEKEIDAKIKTIL